VPSTLVKPPKRTSGYQRRKWLGHWFIGRGHTESKRRSGASVPTRAGRHGWKSTVENARPVRQVAHDLHDRGIPQRPASRFCASRRCSGCSATRPTYSATSSTAALRSSSGMLRRNRANGSCASDRADQPEIEPANAHRLAYDTRSGEPRSRGIGGRSRSGAGAVKSRLGRGAPGLPRRSAPWMPRDKRLNPVAADLVSRFERLHAQIAEPSRCVRSANPRRER
jgi:hypothetical protein